VLSRHAAACVCAHQLGRLSFRLLSCYEDEYSYVLDGTIGGRVGDHEVVAGQGSYVVEPRRPIWSSPTRGGSPRRGLRGAEGQGRRVHYRAEEPSTPACASPLSPSSVDAASSRPNEIRVLGLQPVTASAAAIEAALSLRHDAFEAELAGFGEHDCALGGDRGSAGGALAAAPAGHLTPVDRPQERDPAHIAAGPIVQRLLGLGNNHRSVK
jgi:hypothetical protein